MKSESEVTQSCPTPSDPMDCSLPDSSVHGIFQARVLEWGAIAFSGLVAPSCPTLCDPMDCNLLSFSASSGELPDRGIEPGSLAFLADSLPAELPGKPLYVSCFIVMHFVYILFIPVVTQKVPSRPQIRSYALVFTFKNYQSPQFLVKS